MMPPRVQSQPISQISVRLQPRHFRCLLPRMCCLTRTLTGPARRALRRETGCPRGRNSDGKGQRESWSENAIPCSLPFSALQGRKWSARRVSP